MPRKKQTPEEIVAKLRHAYVFLPQGSPVADAVRQTPRGRDGEEQLTDDLVALVREHGRLGLRKMAALLRSTSGWVVNDKRVERI